MSPFVSKDEMYRACHQAMTQVRFHTEEPSFAELTSPGLYFLKWHLYKLSMNNHFSQVQHAWEIKVTRTQCFWSVADYVDVTGTQAVLAISKEGDFDANFCTPSSWMLSQNYASSCSPQTLELCAGMGLTSSLSTYCQALQKTIVEMVTSQPHAGLQDAGVDAHLNAWGGGQATSLGGSQRRVAQERDRGPCTCHSTPPKHALSLPRQKYRRQR